MLSKNVALAYDHTQPCGSPNVAKVDVKIFAFEAPNGQMHSLPPPPRAYPTAIDFSEPTVLPALGAVQKKKTAPHRSAGKTLPLKVFDLDGYRPVAFNSTMMCAETIRGTLDCKQWSAP